MSVNEMTGTNSPVKMAAWSRVVQRDGNVRETKKERERENAKSLRLCHDSAGSSLSLEEWK